MGIRTLPLLVDFPAVSLHYRVESHHLISLHLRTKMIARGFVPKFCALPENQQTLRKEKWRKKKKKAARSSLTSRSNPLNLPQA